MTIALRQTQSTQAALSQLVTAAVLLTFVSFASGWRLWLTLELTAYFLASGSALLIYARTTRPLPLKTLAETWLPILPIQLVAFLVLLGGGLAIAEGGSSLSGIALLAAGYGALAAQSTLRVLRSVLS
jgi:hypothetical protein